MSKGFEIPAKQVIELVQHRLEWGGGAGVGSEVLCRC
jgi:hypothetical protein